ncbi:hypothetical protein AMATHDRAFT_3242 [Amanita thiersii Skay4041]|uniref:Uncharacterized protein n=1 Tax=Amanita thiersii Skay4041 TaxID=703135 RepID=A0A2A9NMC0_9AGAR|nr:hypothetical protein AMATHDRAFT_3242 [Amanita thiersii Skay4041]
MVLPTCLLLLSCLYTSVRSAEFLELGRDSSYRQQEQNIWRRSSSRTIPENGFFDPVEKGGSMLTQSAKHIPLLLLNNPTDFSGQGEPLNVIISGASDPTVLVDQDMDGGLGNYFLSFGFSSECLGQHIGNSQRANLGDGQGYHNETAVIRWNYGDPQLGSCKETVQGGNHFRYWIQDGHAANSGAIFMAVSYELPLAQFHDIVPNGYNLGRDYLIGNITKSSVPTLSLVNTTSYTGTTSWNGYTYQSHIKYTPNLLQNTSVGINHNLSVGVNGLNAVDGLVAVIHIAITQKPETRNSAFSSPSLPLYGPLALALAMTFSLL